ncbi:hypothetical protein PR048_005990 [Dryococelus australis]|uniref:Uncharacterized protein n=1 Tax=Dryococelus australis TaxID=614101 RepID=A0ABQ9I9R7_9NEOP|nr:hypothetical protein PR048_005990 [Dryococelus australis]
MQRFADQQLCSPAIEKILSLCWHRRDPVCSWQRLHHSDLKYDEEHSILLPKCSRLVELVINQLCEDFFHPRPTARNMADTNKCFTAKIAEDDITWHFDPPSALHFGGLREAGLRYPGFLFSKVAGTHLLSYEKLYMMLTQIELQPRDKWLKNNDTLKICEFVLITDNILPLLH